MQGVFSLSPEALAKGDFLFLENFDNEMV